MAKARVAILRTQPETVVEDYIKVCEFGGMNDALNPEKTTILKDNISWHFLYPGSNTPH